MNLYLLWGLGAAVAWGSADFCAKKASTRFGFWPTVWAMNAVGALAMAGVWAGGGVVIRSSHLLLLVGLALGNAVGGVAFYFALEHGPLALVSPITAAYPVVSAVLAYWITGERLGAWLVAAVAGVIAGTLLASMGESSYRHEHPRAQAALLAAVASALIFGSVFFSLAAHAGATSATAPVLVFRWVGAAALALPLVWGWRVPAGLWRSGWVWSTGLLDSFAYLLFAEGGKHLPVSIVSALSGLFTVWTLVLAVIFLRERLIWRQWVGVAFILAGIAALVF